MKKEETIFTYIHTFTRARVHTSTHTIVHVNTHVHTYTFMQMHVHIHTHTQLCMWMHMYTQTHMHTKKRNHLFNRSHEIAWQILLLTWLLYVHFSWVLIALYISIKFYLTGKLLCITYHESIIFYINAYSFFRGWMP